jgi:hypothetical protein
MVRVQIHYQRIWMLSLPFGAHGTMGRETATLPAGHS